MFHAAVDVAAKASTLALVLGTALALGARSERRARAQRARRQFTGRNRPRNAA